MKTAFVMATGQCNNACDFCFNRGLSPAVGGEDFLSAADFREAAKPLGTLGFGNFVFTGGEPLLHPALDELLLIAGRVGRADLITNGTLLDEGRADALAKQLPGTLIWSLNDLYNRLPDSAAFLNETRSKLAMLAGYFTGRLSTIFVFTAQTRHLIEPVFGMCREAGVGVILQPAHVAASNAGAEAGGQQLLAESWKEVEKAMEPWVRLYGTYRYMDYLNTLYGDIDARPTRCQAAGGFCVVDTDRTVYPCFHRRDLLLGKIGEGGVSVLQKNLAEAAKKVGNAHCFGSHCVSMFVE